MTILVVGARPNSLGSAVCERLADEGYVYETAGISGETWEMDINDQADIKSVLNAVKPSQIVCTVGINQPKGLREDGLWEAMSLSANANYIGPIILLQEWLQMLDNNDTIGTDSPRQFVAISSNSAHIARRNSISYCASKAALSMALRCAAREIAGEGRLVYGYEPGLIAGTPMSADSAAQFDGPLHRMYGVGAQGLFAYSLAEIIVDNLKHPSMALNGAMIRLDAGEQ